MSSLLNLEPDVINSLLVSYNITEGELYTLITNLSSKFWRLNNLYIIKDKNGVQKTLKLNSSQTKVLKSYQHNKKIILKSRQQGISTLFLAYNLDGCIFEEGYEAGIQSYGQTEAEKLSIRAELMWEKFPPIIKEILGITVIKNNSSGIYFSNKSVLKIGNFRGDTLQSLHVSELGKIAKKYPEKAKELKTGAFEAVSTNNIITIESTAEGTSGLFYDMWVKAQTLRDTNATLTPLDFQAIFLSWMEDPDCNLQTQVTVSKEIQTYLDDLEDTLSITLEDTQRWWYQKKYETLGSDMTQEYPSTPEEAFTKSIGGAYYEQEFKALSLVSDVYDPNLLVYSSMDPGMNDTFSIGFFQIRPQTDKMGEQSLKVTMIGEYYNNGKSLEYYKEIYDALSRDKGWRFGAVYVPHDMHQRELHSGVTRIARMNDLGFRTTLLSKHRVIEGIEITRQFLKTVEIDRSCVTALSAIQNYRKKFDDHYGVYLDKPLHDEHSHPADMLRYMAVGLKLYPPTQFYTQRQALRRTYVSGYDI